MDWQYETDAQALIDGQEQPVRAAWSTYRHGAALRWHGALTVRDAAVRQALFDATDLQLRLPGGWEGPIKATASASGSLVHFTGMGDAPA